MKIFVVIPVFNESKRIKAVIEDIRKTGLNLNILVVDDGSTDDSFRVVKKTNTQIIRHKVNLGKGAAMKTGAAAAFSQGAEAVIFMDSDGQHSAKDLFNFSTKLNKGFEVIFGIRKLDLNMPLFRFLGNKFASVLVNLLFGIYISDILCGFRAMTQKAFDKIGWESLGYGVEIEMVIRTAKHSLKYCEIPVETIYYDRNKGVTILDSFGTIIEIFRWRLKL